MIFNRAYQYWIRKVIIIILVALIISPVSAQKAVISQSRYNTLYCKFSNPVEVAVSNYSSYDIMLYAKYTKIEKIDSNVFLIKPPCTDNLALIVKALKNGDTISLDTVKFSIKQMPDPVARLENFPERNNIFTKNRLIAELKDSDYEVEFTIISFNVIIRRGNKVIDSKLFTYDLLEDAFIEMGKNAKSGDRLHFDDIMVQREDGELREIRSVYYQIP